MQIVGHRIGHYKIERQLGMGGMGVVYLAEDLNVSRQVALKMIRTDTLFSSDPIEIQEALRLFEREAQAIARLNHPHILTLHDYNIINIQGTRAPYMVMPFCKDGSFETWLQGSLPLSPKFAAPLIRQIADALQYAHNRQIIHRDVKPANILLRQQGNANSPDLLLTDFGIAAIMDGTSSSGKVLRGSPAYMSPEQWNGQPTFATDQYALAVIAYRLLTGRTPFKGNQQQLMYQHCNDDPQLPSSLNPSLPQQLDSILLKALAKKPEDRYPTVVAFAQALQNSLPSPTSSSNSVNSTLLHLAYLPKAIIFLMALLGITAYISSSFLSLTWLPFMGLSFIMISLILGLIESIRLNRWGWFLCFLLLSPLAGIVYGILPTSKRQGISFEQIFTSVMDHKEILMGIGVLLVLEIIGMSLLTSFANEQVLNNLMVNRYSVITSSKPVVDDPLSDPSNGKTKSDSWDKTSNCVFIDQSYQSSDLCSLRAKSFTNFALQVEIRILSLNDNTNTAYAGVILRDNQKQMIITGCTS